MMQHTRDKYLLYQMHLHQHFVVDDLTLMYAASHGLLFTLEFKRLFSLLRGLFWLNALLDCRSFFPDASRAPPLFHVASAGLPLEVSQTSSLHLNVSGRCRAPFRG
jgi:hypothetical protein